jgi:phosphoheptose isomerase
VNRARNDVGDQVAAELRESAAVLAHSSEQLAPSVAEAAEAIAGALARGGKLLIAGNGGSAADAQHMAAELIGRFRRERRPAPGIALVGNPATVTAIANDYDFGEVFSRQVEALGRRGDVLLAISTSGSSPNVIEAVRTAKARGIGTIALTGGDGGELAAQSDLAIVVDSTQTARIQETHLSVIHAICEIADASLAAEAVEPTSTGQGQVLDRAQLIAARQGWRNDGAEVVWTNGCFDLLHVGHVRFLEQARSLGDVLIVGVNSDSSVRELKGPARPIVPEAERAEVLAALAAVDAVTIFAEATPIEILGELQPDIHCKGGDYPNGDDLPESETVKAYGGRVEILGFTEGSSTSDLLQRTGLGGNGA